MKIALVRQRYNPFGGAERFVSRAMDALRAKGAVITLVTREWPGGADFDTLICNPFHIGRLWRDAGFARSVCGAIARRGFDLVQSHERIPCCDVYRAGDGVHREWLQQRSRTLGRGARLFLPLNPYHRYVMAAEQRLFHSKRLKAVICNSAMVKREIIDWFGLPESRLHVIYSGVDTGAFHPGLRDQHLVETRKRHGIPAGATLHLLVGSGFERKGIPALLQAVTRLPENACLLVVGADKKLRKYENMAAMLGIGSRVRFVGGQQDVRPFYGAADTLVLPTLYDPFPNVALEAMAAGLPVITSTKSGAAELIEAGHNGYVCDALDTEGLANAMNLCADSDHRTVLGAAARQTVEGLNLDAMAEKMLGIYRSLLGTAP